MKKILKYELKTVDGVQEIELPKYAQVLSVGAQRNTICFWVLVNGKLEGTEVRAFEIFGTGMIIPEVPKERNYLGQAQLSSTEVYHVFEQYEK